MRRAALLTTALVLIVGAGALAIFWAGEDGAWHGTRNVLVNRPEQLDANNSPSLAVNPRRRSNLALTHRVDRPAFSARLQWTEDGGRSWQSSELPLPDGLDRPYAPDLAFGPDGTLYVSYVNLVGNGNVPDNLWLARSSDGGRTLSAPVKVTGQLAFQGRLAVSGRGTVYVTWLQAKAVGLLRMPELPNPIVVSSSTDGGHTFTQPVQASDPDRQRVAAATPLVDADDRLLLLYEDFRGNRRDFEFLEGPPAEDPFALVLTASTDGGATFSRGVEVESTIVAARRFLVFLPEFPSMAAGADGALMVAWADARNGDEDVFVRRSDDGGQTWTPPVQVNDNRPRDGTAQYLPRIGIAPSNRVDVLFLDRRRDRRNIMTDAYVASSEDGGRTFKNVRLSSESFDSRVGPFIDEKLPVDFGSRLGIVSGDTGPLGVWTDTRFGTEGTGRQDILSAGASRSRHAPFRWAVVAGLTSLGVTCCWQGLRRRLATPPGGAAGGAQATHEDRGPGPEAVP